MNKEINQENEINNNLNQENKINNNLNQENKIVNEKEQNSFLDTMIGKAINSAVDIGIRALLPNFLEDQLINLKDNLLNYGLKEGISQTIKDTLDLGKSAIGIVTGEFKNINQMQNAVKEGGIIDGVSTVLDFVINNIRKAGLINNNVENILTTGKDVILNNVESNIQNTFKDQIKNETNLDKYIKNWKDNFEDKNFKKMEKEFKNIEKELNKLVPLESKIKEARVVESIHNLIKNKGEDFNLTKSEIELIEKLN